MPTSTALWDELVAAASKDSFLPAASGVFLLAVIHAFMAPWFARRAHALHEAQAARVRQGLASDAAEPVGLKAACFHLLGEVEVVFGLWAGVLFALLVVWPGKGWTFACRYVESGDYALAAGVDPVSSAKFIEPLFVFIIMALASARPVLFLAERLLGAVAGWLGGTPAARWFVILTFAPLLGSLVTEPAAMTIAALLLSAQFYASRPSERLKYASLALLFVNISVGGALTHFAAPPVVMVAAKWGWGLGDVFGHFGVASIATVLLGNAVYFLCFRRELVALRPAAAGTPPSPAVPAWVVLTHLALMVWTVLMLGGHRPVLMVAGLLAFLAFTVATPQWQSPVRLRGPLLVGFFLAGLVVLGGVQGWWISPVLVRLNEGALMGVSVVLTSFNDNAAITYLASQVPALGSPGAAAEALRHAVLSGALAGGGLTVIANAPNPAGQSILAPYFEGGVSPVRLALWAFPPTLIAVASYFYLR